MNAETLSPIHLINLGDLDVEIDRTAHRLRVSREHGCSDLVAKIEGDILRDVLPALVVLEDIA